MTGRGHLHGMRRWAEPLTVIVVFAIVMTAIGWGVNAAVPNVDAWLVDHIGKAGAWTALVAVWLATGIYAWIGHRPKAGRAAGK